MEKKKCTCKKVCVKVVMKFRMNLRAQHCWMLQPSYSSDLSETKKFVDAVNFCHTPPNIAKHMTTFMRLV